MSQNNISTSVQVCQPEFDWKELQVTISFCKDNGLRIIPLWWGQKNPVLKEWKHLQNTPPTTKELAPFYSGEPVNIGAICGLASGGLVVFAFNDKKGAVEFFGGHYPKLLERTFVVMTSRGSHVYLRPDTPMQSRTLARGDNPSWLEIRSDGNYCVLPPSLHPDGVKYLAIGNTNIVRPRNLAGWAEDRIAELGLHTAKEGRKETEATTKDKHWVQDALLGVSKGSRRATATRLVGYFRTKLPQGIILALMTQWGERCKPPCSDSDDPMDIETVVRNVCKYNKEEKVLELVSLDALLDMELDNPGELVRGILPQAGVCIIGGEPGSGKTWLVLALARDVASGKPFLNRFATRQGGVLIIDEESGKGRLQSRMNKLGGIRGLPIELSIMKAINLSDPSWEDPLRHAIEEKRPKVVVLDSLVRMHRGDENAATEMAKLFATLSIIREELGCSFIITHHLRKRSQQRALNTLEQRLRGSSDIAAYADTVLGLDKIDNRIVLSQLKNRDGEFFKPLALGIDDIEEDRTEVVVLAEIDEEADKRKVARELIRKALKEKPTLREELVVLAKGEGISDRTVVDSLKSLIDAGEVDRWKDGRKTVYGLKNDDSRKGDCVG